MNTNLSLGGKIGIFVATFVLVATLAVDTVVNFATSEILVSKVEEQVANDLESISRTLADELLHLRKDADLLSHYPLFTRLSREGGKLLENDSWRRGVDSIFSSMLKNRPHYTQIRFIGAKNNGKEIIRVDQINGNIIHVKDTHLQEKGGRTYFKKTMALDEGQIYLSEINLNREHGAVSFPKQPTIRIGIPLVSEPTKDKIGVLIINVNVAQLLSEPFAHMREDLITYITNDQGDYLFHPNPEKAFAFEFNQKSNLQDEAPDSKDFYSQKDRTYWTRSADAKSGKENLFVKKIFFDPEQPDRFIVLIIEIYESLLLDESRQIHRASLIAVVVVVLLVGFLAWIVANRITKPLNKITRAMGRFAAGEKVEEDFGSGRSDEIGQLSRSFSAMTEERRRREKELNTSREALEWARRGRMMLSGLIRDANSPEALGKKLLDLLSDYIGSQSSRLFALDPENSKNFFCLAQFAVASGSAPVPLVPGFGVGGEVINSKRQVAIGDVPENYCDITSTLGSSKPKELLVQPLIAGGVVVGVLELASLSKFSKNQKEFLSEASETIGIAIQAASNNKHLEKLLEYSQRQSEELEAQQEELRANNDELQSHTNELVNQRVELEAANIELEEQRSVLENQTLELEASAASMQLAQMELEAKSEAIEKSSNYKSEFLANMSHELRTPLNSILLLSRLFADNLEANLSEDQVKSADTIYASGTDLLNLINDILDLSRIEAGKLDLIPEDLNTIDFFQAQGRSFESLCSSKNLDFSINISEQMPAKFQSDSVRLGQIVRNLLSNATKFTEKGGVDFNIHPSPDRPDYFVIEVKDTGIGIPIEKQDQIFEAFQQVDGTISRRFGGTGLGLAISKKLVELLGGRISVSSQEGVGSTFTAIFPLVLPSDQSSESPLEVDPGTGSNDDSKSPDGLTKRTPEIIMLSDREVPSDLSTILEKHFTVSLYQNISKIPSTTAHPKIVVWFYNAGLDINEFVKDLEQKWRVMPKVLVYSTVVLSVVQQKNLDQLDAALVVKTHDNSDNQSVSKRVIEELTQMIDDSSKAPENRFTETASLSTDPAQSVLLVDDDERNVFSLSRALKLHGYNVETARNGQEAIDLLNGGLRPGCIVMDVMMPIMDGLVATRKIRSSETYKEIPIISLTAKAMTKDREDCMAAGANDYLAKPVDIHKLISLIKVWMNRAKA